MKIFGADVVKNDTMKMVHDDDLNNLLISLGAYEGVIEGNFKCLHCGKTIDVDNIAVIVPQDDTVQFVCDNELCMQELIGV